MSKTEVKNRPIEQLLSEVSNRTNLAAPATRRKKPIDEMARLEKSGLDCFSCSGLCCLNQYNSMQVDPIQALELLAWLEGEQRINEELTESLDNSIKKFRLDREVSVGRGREYRRYYTCPFFKGESLGCTVSRAAKPYGCLGFNPKEAGVSIPGKCGSNIELLEKREELYAQAESIANKEIKDELGIWWDKKNLPFALKDMIAALRKKSVID